MKNKRLFYISLSFLALLLFFIILLNGDSAKMIKSYSVSSFESTYSVSSLMCKNIGKNFSFSLLNKLKDNLKGLNYLENININFNNGELLLSGEICKNSFLITDGENSYILKEKFYKISNHDISVLSKNNILVVTDKNELSMLLNNEGDTLKVLETLFPYMDIIKNVYIFNRESSLEGKSMYLTFLKNNVTLFVKDISDIFYIDKSVEIIKKESLNGDDEALRCEYILENSRLEKKR